MDLTDRNQAIIATITTTSYLPRAIVLARSIKKQMPGVKVVVCIVEEKVPGVAKSLMGCFDDLVLAKDLGFTDFIRFIFRYNQAQGANACKAQFMIYLLKTYQSYRYFIFLDSDTKSYGPLDDLIEHLKTDEIVISPHFIGFSPENTFYQLGVVHESGVFNTGLYAIKRGASSQAFLQWWANILLNYCFKDPNKGIWNEQKWLDLAPGIFEFYVQKDPGYNVGPWNFHERHLTVSDHGSYMVNGRSLRVFHFSGLFSGYFNNRVEKTRKSQRKIIEDIKKEYINELVKADHDVLSTKPWTYDCFRDGRKIEKKSRTIYRSNPSLFANIKNPFAKNDLFFTAVFEKQKKNGSSIMQPMKKRT